MNTLAKLPDIFHATEAYALGVTPAQLKTAADSGDLERRMRGVYKKVGSEDLGEWTTYEVLSKGLKCRFAVCLLSALSYYGLSDQILNDAWILIDNKSAIRHKGVQFLRSRNPMWDIGITNIDGIPFTTIERTIVDCLTHQRKVNPNEAYGALVKALRTNKVKVWDIAKVADSMGSAKKIEKYLEPFLYAG